MKFEEELVSIIVVTYNSERTVKETIDSILKQSYKDIEIVLSDDCSTDKTLEVIQDIDYGRVPMRLTSTEKNSGPACNINNGIRCARGNYIKLLAGDDRLCPNAIEVYMKNYKEHEIGVAHFRCFGIDADHNIKIEDYYYKRESFFRLSNREQYKELLKQNQICTPAVGIIKKSDLKKLNYMDERYPFMEDYPFFIRCAGQGFRFYRIEEILVEYRISQTSLSKSGRRTLAFYSERSFFWKKRAWELLKNGFVIQFLKDAKNFV